MADDDLTQAMAALTAERTRQMVDACAITRPGEVPQTPELDADGNVIAPAAPQVYAGRCTIATPRTADRGSRTVTDESGVPNLRLLRVPHDVTLQPGDLVEVTASAFSPGLIGDVFLVLGEEERSYATHRRYQLRGSSWLSPPAGP